MVTNLELAKRLDEFAGGLTCYNYLPAMEFALVGHLGLVRMQPSGTTARGRVEAIGSWALAFHAPVLLDLSNMDQGFVQVSTTVEFAGRQVFIKTAIAPSQYREIEPGLGLGEIEAGLQVQVTADQLLAAVKDGAAA